MQSNTIEVYATKINEMHYNKTKIHAMQQNKMQNMLKHTYETSACNVGQ